MIALYIQFSLHSQNYRSSSTNYQILFFCEVSQITGEHRNWPWAAVSFLVSSLNLRSKSKFESCFFQRLHIKHGTAPLFLGEWQYLIKHRKHITMIKMSSICHCTAACKTTGNGFFLFVLRKYLGKLEGKIHTACWEALWIVLPWPKGKNLCQEICF